MMRPAAGDVQKLFLKIRSERMGTPGAQAYGTAAISAAAGGTLAIP
jgi:hypothetical protein